MSARHSLLIIGTVLMVIGAVVIAVALTVSSAAESPSTTTTTVTSTTTTTIEESIPGTSEIREGDLAAAREKLTVYLQTNPSDVDALYLLALVEEQSGHPDAALQVYEDILDQDPRDFEAHFRIGHIHRREGELELSIQDFEQALQLNGDFTAARVALADALAESGEVDRAIVLYYDVIEAQPMGVHLDQVRYDLAVLLVRTGQPDNAALQLTKALVENPANEEARALLEELYAPTTTTTTTPSTTTTT
jgi:tetratricopeptide (TPR) repeat protein